MPDGHSRTDPLSGTTRKAKRNLILASLIAIALPTFDVTLDKLSLAGLSFSHTPGLPEFLLLSLILYFAITFGLHYYADVKDFTGIPHQRETESRRHEKYNEFVRDFLSRSLWKDLVSTGTLKDDFATQYSRWVDGYPSTLRLVVRMIRYPITWSSYLRHANEKRNEVVRRFQRQVWQFPLAYFWFGTKLDVPTNTVRLLYWLRSTFFECIFPALFALLAILVLIGAANLRPLAHYVPKTPKPPVVVPSHPDSR